MTMLCCKVHYRAQRRFIGPNTHQPKGKSPHHL
jgi:hypothetical protein